MPHSALSFIGILPVEVLASIFLLTAPVFVTFEDPTVFYRDEPDDNTDFIFPGTLGAVSKAWRDIVVCTPSLWTSLRWTAGEHDPMLLALHLMRSKTLPLHLMLFFYGRTPIHSLVAPEVDSILLPNMSRIATLYLSGPSHTWLSQLDRLTSISTLTITWWYSTIYVPGDEVLLNKCHSLRRLSLTVGVECHQRVVYRLPCSLEELYLKGIPLDTSVKLLLMNPNLVKLSVQGMRFSHQELDDDISQRWFSQQHTFENLEELTWYRQSNGWFRRLLSQAFAPRLRRLCLMCRNSPRLPMEEENQFFRRLPETLSTLEVDHMEHFSPFDSPLFHPSLENLILRYSSLGYVSAVFKALTPAPGNQKRLPNLRSLSIWGIAFRHIDGKLIERDLQPMVLMLEQRLAEGDVFCLTFSYCAIDWTPAIQGRIRSLREKGVQLRIIEGSGAVDWLE